MQVIHKHSGTHSNSVATAKGPRRMYARYSAERLLWVIVTWASTSRSTCVQALLQSYAVDRTQCACNTAITDHQIHQATFDIIRDRRQLLTPHTATRVPDPGRCHCDASLLCLLHHAVDSGMELGMTVPNARSNLLPASLLSPDFTKARFLKNNCRFMLLSAWKKPHVLVLRNQLCRLVALF